VPGAIIGGLIIGVGEKLSEVFWARSSAAASRSGSPTCWRWCSCWCGRRACSARRSSIASERADDKEDDMLYRENGQFKTSYRADQQIFPILQDRVVMLACMAFAFVGVPLLASEYLFRAILIPFLILSLAALGLNILVGYCGQISLGTGRLHGGGRLCGLQLLVRIDGMPCAWPSCWAA
jgi:hypothetical protein